MVMFERAPFIACPKCSTASAVGTLWVGGTSLTRRCKQCRHEIRYDLPKLHKKVIYLDQNAISNIYNILESNSPKIGNNHSFWQKVSFLARRVFMLQQAIFPLSDIHRDETLVFRQADKLHLMHEMLGGDVSFVRSEAIITAQTINFLNSFIENVKNPSIEFDIEDAIEGVKDIWISDFHISANSDLSVFADEVRSDRDAIGPAYNRLLDHWQEHRPTFSEALRVELESYGTENIKALQSTAIELSKAIERGDFDTAMKLSSKRIYRQFIYLKSYVEEFGISNRESTSVVFDFWKWKGNHTLPHNKISSYLFAALARRISSGQKNMPSLSIFNDFRAISVYGPYVDAMFLDNECANILNERTTQKRNRFVTESFLYKKRRRIC